MDHLFRHIAVGPLSAAESRKLLLRLPTLAGCEPAEVAKLLRVIGGHPRMLEFLDGLLRGGQARLPRVTKKLRAVASEAGPDLRAAIDDMDEATPSSSARVTCCWRTCSASPPTRAMTRRCCSLPSPICRWRRPASPGHSPAARRRATPRRPTKAFVASHHCHWFTGLTTGMSGFTAGPPMAWPV